MKFKSKMLRKWNGRDGWYEITPAEAQAILEWAAKNRPLRDWKAQRIAGAISTGRWLENGESIVFDDRDKLIDGQHRLRACALAGKPIRCYCVFGVSGKVFPSIDQGDKRGGGDLASLMGFPNAHTTAAVARLAIQYADGTIVKTGREAAVDPARLTAYMERNRDRLTDAVEQANKHRSGLEKLVPISQAAFVYYVASESSNGKAVEFVEKLATGEGLRKGDALLEFRRRMTDLIGDRHKLLQQEKVALLIKTWNAFVTNKPVGVLRWRRETEVFPSFSQKSA